MSASASSFSFCSLQMSGWKRPFEMDVALYCCMCMDWMGISWLVWSAEHFAVLIKLCWLYWKNKLASLKATLVRNSLSVSDSPEWSVELLAKNINDLIRKLYHLTFLRSSCTSPARLGPSPVRTAASPCLLGSANNNMLNKTSLKLIRVYKDASQHCCAWCWVIEQHHVSMQHGQSMDPSTHMLAGAGLALTQI